MVQIENLVTWANFLASLDKPGDAKTDTPDFSVRTSQSNHLRFLHSYLYPLPPPPPSPQNWVLVGFTVFSMSVIPSFCQHLRFFLNN